MSDRVINTRLVSGAEVNAIVPGLVRRRDEATIFECYTASRNKRVAAIVHRSETMIPNDFAFEIGDNLSTEQFTKFTDAGEPNQTKFEDFANAMF